MAEVDTCPRSNGRTALFTFEGRKAFRNDHSLGLPSIWYNTIDAALPGAGVWARRGMGKLLMIAVYNCLRFENLLHI